MATFVNICDRWFVLDSSAPDGIRSATWIETHWLESEEAEMEGKRDDLILHALGVKW